MSPGRDETDWIHRGFRSRCVARYFHSRMKAQCVDTLKRNPRNLQDLELFEKNRFPVVISLTGMGTPVKSVPLILGILTLTQQIFLVNVGQRVISLVKKTNTNDGQYISVFKSPFMDVSIANSKYILCSGFCTLRIVDAT